MPTTQQQLKPAAVWLQEPEPILCECARWRHNLMGPHRDHRAELERARVAGRLFDDVWYAAVSIEPMLRDEVAS
jgi:hypothetical protein